MQQLNHNLSIETRQYNDLTTKRQELFTNKSPIKEEELIGNQLAQHEQNQKLTEDKYNQIKLALNTTTTKITSLEQQLLPIRRDLVHAENIFATKLVEYNFGHENQFKQALLTREELSSLEKAATQLSNKQIELSSRKELITTKLTRYKEKPLTSLSQDELTQIISQLNNQIEIINQTIGAIKTKLDSYQDALSKQSGIIKARDIQQNETDRWQQLHALIGSVDGKKFRNFAQGLTFELVVKNANTQLQKMSDRYLLIRDNNAPLELNVVDNYQGGEIRTTKNLSGGESFVVSLALALGLSKLSSNKVQVDSLFLDEGFGTLDEDSLQTALEALASLHQEGKLIGVISHVGALKERISLQIQVEPITGGISKISGIGISNVVF
jgi:DNA repair protein SbcC/Rad50